MRMRMSVCLSVQCLWFVRSIALEVAATKHYQAEAVVGKAVHHCCRLTACHPRPLACNDFADSWTARTNSHLQTRCIALLSHCSSSRKRTINLFCFKLSRIIVLGLRLHCCKMIEQQLSTVSGGVVIVDNWQWLLPLYSWHSSSMIGQRAVSVSEICLPIWKSVPLQTYYSLWCCR